MRAVIEDNDEEDYSLTTPGAPSLPPTGVTSRSLPTITLSPRNKSEAAAQVQAPDDDPGAPGYLHDKLLAEASEVKPQVHESGSKTASAGRETMSKATKNVSEPAIKPPEKPPDVKLTVKLTAKQPKAKIKNIAKVLQEALRYIEMYLEAGKIV